MERTAKTRLFQLLRVGPPPLTFSLREDREPSLARLGLLKQLWEGMTKDQIQTAMNEGIPFLIRMADGEKYEVTDR